MSTLRAYRGVPPLRASTFEPDEHDAKRVQFVKDRWHSQDYALRLRDRQIEENVRMLCGQQWTVWSDLMNRFVDVSHYMSERDLRWRQRPTVNKLLYWYIITHARLTENPPILAFQPASADRFDAELAEVMDTVFKAKWKETGMLEVLDRLASHLIPGGTAYLKSRINPTQGSLLSWRGPGIVPVFNNGVMTGESMFVEDAAYDKDGSVLTYGFIDEEGIGYTEPEGVSAYTERKGALEIDVLSAPEVRSTWGEQTPFHRRRWQMHRGFYTTEDVYDIYGLDVEPDIRLGSGGTDIGELQTLLMGMGFFGAANGSNSLDLADTMGATELVSVYEMWEPPSKFPGTEESETAPGGRLTVVAGDKIARDGQRYAPFKYGSPIRRFDFINLPGRPSGTSPQESMNPIQRAFNRNTAIFLQHSALSGDPKALIHRSTGITEDSWTNEPGTAFVVNTEPGINHPVSYLSPPALGPDVYQTHQFLGRTLDEMGSTEGTTGRMPGRDASGEVVKELRFNSDRPVAATTRRAVLELGRLVEDWIVILPLITTEEEVITYAGEDSIAQTVAVYPEMFQRGRVNVDPDVESMLPEGRGERQQRVYKMYLDGIFGQPGSPEAINRLLELARFPHLGRASRPGGVHRVTAEQNVGKLARGLPAHEVPFFPWYDVATHLAVLENWMASPEWLRSSQEIQAASIQHRDRLTAFGEAKKAEAIQQQTQLAMLEGTVQGAANAAANPATAQPQPGQ